MVIFDFPPNAPTSALSTTTIPAQSLDLSRSKLPLSHLMAPVRASFTANLCLPRFLLISKPIPVLLLCVLLVLLGRVFLATFCRPPSILPAAPSEWKGPARWTGALARSDAADAAVVSPRVFSPDPACPNLFVITSDPGGVGHRMGALAFGIAAAEAAGAAVVLDDALWEAERQQGGGLGYLRTLLGLDMFLSARELGLGLAREGDGDNKRAQDPPQSAKSLRSTLLMPKSSSAVPSWRDDFTAPSFVTRWGSLLSAPPSTLEAAAHAARSTCGAVFRVRSGSGGACTFPDSGDTGWCFQAFHGGFQAARAVLRTLYARTEYSRRPLTRFGVEAAGGGDASPLRRRPPYLVVAWHIRNGDITLTDGGRERFRRLAAAVSIGVEACNAVEVRHFILCERPIQRDDPVFSDLFSLPGLARSSENDRISGGASTPPSVLWDMEPDESFAYLAGADVLVHTGSSFAVAAATVADPTQVFVYSPPKETASWAKEAGGRLEDDDSYKVYRLEGSTPAQADGTVLDRDMASFKAQVRARANRVGITCTR
jgi:hypothetical protein